MIVIEDTTGITVKKTVEDAGHVRINDRIILWADDGTRLVCGWPKKPPAEFSLNELRDLLEDVETLSGGRGARGHRAYRIRVR